MGESNLEWLNYHHLLYFWHVARSGGSITRASKELRLAQQTVGAQIRQLESVLGETLFVRSGRTLTLTEVGRIVFRYAEDIFSLGREMQETIRGHAGARPLSLVVGIVDFVPKLVAFRLLRPALGGPRPVHLTCREDAPFDVFLDAVASHEIDLLIADRPATGDRATKVFSHLLGECSTTVMAAPELAARMRAHPGLRCLSGAPLCLSGRDSMAYAAMKHLFEVSDIQPESMAEVDDTGLLLLLAEERVGAVAIPSLVVAEVQRRYRLESVIQLDEVRHRFYAISAERRLKHPAVAAICESAHRALFGREDGSE